MMTAPGAPFPKTAALQPGRLPGRLPERVRRRRRVGRLHHRRRQAVGDQQERRHRPRPDEPAATSGSSTPTPRATASGCSPSWPPRCRAPGPAPTRSRPCVEARKHDSHLFVVLETLEYLKRGGRISAAQAAIGGILSVKPIITIEDGVVETADEPRTREQGARAVAGAHHRQAHRTRGRAVGHGRRPRRLRRRAGRAAQACRAA